MNAAGKTILVVDDDEVTLEVTRERLERVGFTVSTRDTAIGTSALIVKTRPDYVLLDLNMPGIGGESIAKLLKQKQLPSVVILHSSMERNQLLTMAQACGAHGAIEKTHDERYFTSQLER